MALQSISTILDTLKTRLSTIPGISSCQIGLESNVAPGDYPIIRLAPSTIEAHEAGMRRMNLMVYYGSPLSTFVDLETAYGELLGLEEQIVDRLRIGDGYRIKHIKTVTDEDSLASYKLFMSEFEVTG